MLRVTLKYYILPFRKKIHMVQNTPVSAHERPLNFQLTLARDKGIFSSFYGKLLVRSTFQELIFIHIYFIKFMSGYNMVESSTLFQAYLSHLHVGIFLPPDFFF